MADDARARADIEGEVVPLWPESLASAEPEIAFRAPAAGGGETTMLRNVSVPSLTVFRPDAAKANGVGVIVCPGGGWRLLAWEHEGVDLASLQAHQSRVRGVSSEVSPRRDARRPRTSTPGSWPASPPASTRTRRPPRRRVRWPASSPMATPPACASWPPKTAGRALTIVRERASEWGVRQGRVGMVGFSAGAFLASDVAMAPGGQPLAFVAPIYGGETRGAPVPADAPPLFTVIAQDDRMLFKVVEGLYADWSNADRRAEVAHLHQRRPRLWHGSTGPARGPLDRPIRRLAGGPGDGLRAHNRSPASCGAHSAVCGVEFDAAEGSESRSLAEASSKRRCSDGASVGW